MLTLQDQQLQELERIRKKYSLRLIIAFGSRVKGLLHANSDLDLGILFDHGRYRLDVLAELQRLLPDYEVDIANLSRADPLLLNEINKNCQLLAGDPEEFQEFRIYAFRRYQDFRPYLRLEAETTRRHLKTL